MRTKTRALITLLVGLLIVMAGPPSYAVLKAVGPVSQSTGFFPAWYSDRNNDAFELCLPSPGPELQNGYCLLLPADIPDPNAPVSFPNNFPEEAFWWSAGATIDLGNGDSADLVLALEAAFLNGAPAAGDQVSFGRVRIRIDTDAVGTYTVTHPFGVETFTVTAEEAGNRAINFTRDIGITTPGDFTGALISDIGPFLKASAAPGGAPLPYVELIPGKFYVADPNTPTNVTGSPFNTNFFRVEGPAGFAAVETTDFNLQGRVFRGTPVTIDRATYRRTGGNIIVDAWASSLSGASLAAGLVGSPQASMQGSNESFFGSFTASLLPSLIEVTASMTGRLTSTVQSSLSDVVSISQADFDSGSGVLTIAAASSDQNVATLTVESIGAVSNGGAATFTLPIPPSSVTVTSPQGGSDTEPVTIVAGASGNIPPVATADAYSVNANATLTVAAPGVLGNDTDPDNNLPLTAVLVTGPSNGSLTLNANGSFTYAPNLNFAGTDSFTYNARDSLGALSPAATVTITVNQVVNTPPTAANDAYIVNANTVLNVPAPGVLGNDSDPDGNLPLTAVLVTGVSNGSLTLNANGSFTYTPTAGFSGTDSFTYRAQDSLGALSALAATVTITVNAPESIAITRAEFRITGSEWRVEGTSAPLSVGTGNTITIYLGPTVGGPVIGTATVLADGTWILRQTGINPGSIRTVSAQSSSGARSEGFPLRVRF